MTQIEQIKAEIERLKSQLVRGACAAGIAMETNCKEEAYNEVLAFIDSLPDESCLSECIWGRTTSEESCRYCTAWCHLREPKVKVTTDCNFKEYLRGVFEANNGIENDPDLLVKLHAPTLLELAQKELAKEESAESPDFEAEWKRYTASRKDDMRTNAVTMNVKEVALYFAKWGRKQVLTAKPSEELEEEIHRYFKELENSDCVSNTRRLAKHFAEWQKQQDDELLAIAHFDGVQSGREAERKEMLKTAIEGNVEYSPYAGDDAHIVFSAFVEVKDYDAIPGDSIKMIILTDND